MAQEGDGTGECANSDLSKHKLTIRPLAVMDRPFSRHRQYRDRQTNMNKCLPICKYKQKKGTGMGTFGLEEGRNNQKPQNMWEGRPHPLFAWLGDIFKGA
jgi:hypothetical protein